MPHIPEHRVTPPPPAPDPAVPPSDTSHLPDCAVPIHHREGRFRRLARLPIRQAVIRHSLLATRKMVGVGHDIRAPPKANDALDPALDREASYCVPFFSHMAAILTMYQNLAKCCLSKGMKWLNIVTQHPLFSKEEQTAYKPDYENKNIDEFLRNTPDIAGFRESSD